MTELHKIKNANAAVANDLRAIFASAENSLLTLRLPKGHVVFRQGDPADDVYYIVTGKIQVTVVSDQGKEGVIANFEEGDFFGEGCLVGQRVRMASAATAAASDVVKLNKMTMRRLLDENLNLSQNFMKFMLLRNVRVEADLVDQLFNSSEKRLARLLLLLANFADERASHPVIPKISQSVLAARVGTTRSQINIFMNKFRKMGLIEYNGHLIVHKSLINVIVHD